MVCQLTHWPRPLQIPNKCKSTLMSKPERRRGANINKARQDALALLEGQMRDSIDTSIPTSELLLVPLKQKKKSYERRMQRSAEAMEHHEQAGMLSPGSGYANFPASPMPVTRYSPLVAADRRRRAVSASPSTRPTQQCPNRQPACEG